MRVSVRPRGGAIRVSALIAALVTIAAIAGCGSPKSDSPPTEPSPINLYGTDGNTSNSLGTALATRPGVLAGMKGTAPIAPLSSEFIGRLKKQYPGLNDLNYAGQSYDAVAIAAMAAEIARSTNPRDIAKYLPGVTLGGQECIEIAECLQLIRAGTDIQFHGTSIGQGGFTDAGEPSTSTYATLHFSRDNKLDDGKTEYVRAGNANEATKASLPAIPSRSQPAKGAPLVIGGLLPKTGQLASQYAPMSAGATLAITEINNAEGVLGRPVVWRDGDDGTNPTVAKQTVTKHIAEKVHVIVGAGGSYVSKEIIPIIAQANVLMISPAATADSLSDIPDNGLFFRTAAPDRLQARALADIVMRDGSRRVFVVARDDSWGQGLLAKLAEDLKSSGIEAANIKSFIYKPSDDAAVKPALGGLIDQLRDFGADGVVIIGFDETSHVIEALAAAQLPLRT